MVLLDLGLCISDEIVVDPLADEALIHLKSYKYSSVDKSWISNHVLRHYV